MKLRSLSCSAPKTRDEAPAPVVDAALRSPGALDRWTSPAVEARPRAPAPVLTRPCPVASSVSSPRASTSPPSPSGPFDALSLSGGSGASWSDGWEMEDPPESPRSALEPVCTNPLLSGITREDLRASDALTPSQSAAILHLSRKAQGASEAAKPTLRKRLKRMGHGAEVFDGLLLHVRDKAPVVIHFDPSKLVGHGRALVEAFLHDTHYRNQFETMVSGGSLGGGRPDWERTLFGGHYEALGVAPRHRPKYGALNLLNHERGTATAYGKCFFTLRNIRLRTTFSFSDSAGDRGPLATVEHFAHILQRMPDAELKALVEIARDPQATTPGAYPSYREAQIHGDIEFARDIEQVAIDSSSAHAAQLRQWAALHGISTRELPCE